MGLKGEAMDRIRAILEHDDRYRVEAYVFTLEALNYTLEQYRKKGHSGHITPRQLLFGIRDYARRLFGYLARAVFEAWGVTSTRDFGEVVFNLADAQLLSRQDSDTKEDFDRVFDFEEAFEREYVHPASPSTAAE